MFSEEPKLNDNEASNNETSPGEQDRRPQQTTTVPNNEIQSTRNSG